MVCYVIMLCYLMYVASYVMLCYVMLCYVMVMLCYVMLCYVMLCYVMTCCVVLRCCVVLLLYCNKIAFLSSSSPPTSLYFCKIVAD